MNSLRGSIAALALLLVAGAALATPDDGMVVGTEAIIDNGSDAERFDIVLISEGYTSEQLSTFAMQAQAFADKLLETAPFSTNCSGINVWRIDVASNGSGIDDPAACQGSGAEVATYFDGTACADGASRRLVRVSESSAIDVLNAQVPGWDQAIVLANTEIYGGTVGSVAVATTAGPWDVVAIHQMAHSAFGLADEYEFFAGCGVDSDRDTHPAFEPVHPNVTLDSTGAKWADLIDAATTVPTTENADCSQCDPQADPAPGAVVVGTYEGAHYHHCAAYRPAFDCMMRNFGEFCPVCQRRILEVLAPFQPANGAPTCDANGPYEVECMGDTSAVMLDGSASSDPDCNELAFSWSGDFDEGTAEGVEPIVNFSGVGDFGVSLEVSDGELMAECQSDVTVQDTMEPMVAAPDDATAECESPDGTMVTLGDAVVDDVCDSAPTVENDAPDLFPLGDTAVTWTATDASGNSGSGTQQVTVEDTTAPEITQPDPVTAECTSPDGTPVDLTDPEVTEVCDAAPVLGNDAPDLYPLGETTVTWTATDASGNSSDAAQSVNVEDTTPPDIEAPADVMAECTSPEGTPVELGDAAAMDVCDAAPVITNDGLDLYPLGDTTVTWTATDQSGNQGMDPQNVSIVDTTPPEFTLTVAPTTLWPPNHKLVTITAYIDAEDICDASLDVRIVSVTSNEPDNGLGDGDTENDIQGARFGEDDRSIRLRAERSGRGDGRIYTIVYSVTDDSGNVTEDVATVTVPKSQGNGNGNNGNGNGNKKN
jgi:hypothetical protein